jgi:hypothetical protein
VSLLDRPFSTLERVIEMESKAEKLGRAVEGLHGDVRQLGHGLIRVETALEVASEGRFRPRLPTRGEDGRDP